MTKKNFRFAYVFLLVLVLSISFAVPAFAISDADVQAQVDSVGRETVTGNVLIWFLCAIGFLKAAQKIDSFMASLGVNVGHTGGSMLAEALIAARGVGTVAGAMGHSLGSGGGHRGGGGGAAASAGGFFKGGLVGMAKRKATSEAVRSATSSTSAVHSNRATSTAETASHINKTATSAKTATHEAHQTADHISTGDKTATHTNQSTSAVTHTQRHTASSFQGIGLGGAIFAKSLMKGGEFANDVISTVARGDMRSTGSITGDLAAQSLRSYMGYTALGEGAKDAPTFSNVEIGGGGLPELKRLLEVLRVLPLACTLRINMPSRRAILQRSILRTVLFGISSMPRTLWNVSPTMPQMVQLPSMRASSRGSPILQHARNGCK